MGTLEEVFKKLGDSLSELTSHVKRGREGLCDKSSFKGLGGDTGASRLRGQDSYEVDVQKATEGLTGGFARGHVED